MKKKISLIIPALTTNFHIEDFLINILYWSIYPSEIIIINTSDKDYFITNHIKESFKDKNIKIKFIFKKKLFPGAARNLGILHSNYDYIGFLDMDTLPYNRDWLKINFKYLLKNNLDGVCGQTIYLANNYIEKIVRASTYGKASLTTIPGSIFKKKTIIQVGKFNTKSRAGEDTDWLKRLDQQKLNIKESIVPVFYKGLFNTNFKIIIKKWFRNYFLSPNLPHLKSQKNFYFLTLLIISVFIGLSYNITSLCITDYLCFESKKGEYFPDITKVFLSISILFYLVARGIVMPIKKKIELNFLFPYKFLVITIFSFILDLVKSTTFLALEASKIFDLDIKKKK